MQRIRRLKQQFWTSNISESPERRGVRTRLQDHCPRSLEHAVSMAIRFDHTQNEEQSDAISRPRYEGRIRAARTESGEEAIVTASTADKRPLVKCDNCGKAHQTLVVGRKVAPIATKRHIVRGTATLATVGRGE